MTVNSNGDWSLQYDGGRAVVWIGATPGTVIEFRILDRTCQVTSEFKLTIPPGGTLSGPISAGDGNELQVIAPSKFSYRYEVPAGSTGPTGCIVKKY
jgi:hypothetical protein